MFRRRNSQSRWQKLKAFIWPRKGFSRVFNYLLQRILRMPGSEYSLAAGVACGAAVSFTPFIGFHLFLALLLAYLIRGNMLAALIGTAVGNPWTFPLIFVVIERVGFSALSYFGFGLSFDFVSENTVMSADVLALIIRMSIGGAILTIISWPFFFCVTYWIVKSWRHHRHMKRMQAALKRQQRTSSSASAHDE